MMEPLEQRVEGLEEFARVRSFLGSHDASHFAAFLAAWNAPHGG